MTGTHSTNRVLLLSGVRTPFRRSGTEYLDLISYDLARSVIQGMLRSSGVSAASVDSVIMGTVVQNASTSNVARDAALAAGLPVSTPAHTVTLACISANRAIADASLMIMAGRSELALAGGVEVLSDVPPVFEKETRKRFFAAQKAKGPTGLLRNFRGVPLKKLLPRAPSIAEFTTGETMGYSADRLAARFGVSREDQDAYALRSHELAAAADAAGHLANEILPTSLPKGFGLLERDNTWRADTSLDKLASLKPAFVKPFGTVTAGNASPLTDGAAAVLLGTERAAGEAGLTPRAVIRDWVFTAGDPGEELLLGPARAVPELLQRNGLEWSDLDVIEIHEAFAGQVLAVLAALSSDSFGRTELGLSGRFADIVLDNINLWGGSISLGHPFGATGARLLTTAANRLEAEDGQLALITACAAGGQAHAMLIERVDR